ncbi:Ig-like domain-containing protein [Sphingorhabdus sp.]|uniref:beta strand repeat-containing protein n=1 Tax=Sphingorhabdus sp. TaxID=1902408 RepID=UPI003D814C6E
MAQDLNGSNANPAKNIVKVNVLRANVKQTKVIDTDIVFVLEDGRTVFIRDGAVQSLLDSGFSVEFSDGDQVTGQELLQSAGAAEISSVALTGPQASSNDGVIVAQAPQAVGTSPVAAPSSGGGLKTWLAVGTPLVGGVLGGVLGGGGGGGAAAAPTTGTGTGTGTTTNVKPATPVINVVANDDKVSAAEKGATAGVAVTGIAEASASVTVNWGSTSKTVTADSAGRWSASFTSAEVPADAPGTTISAIVKSTAGVSSDPATRTVQIDTTPPAAPVIANVAGDNVIGPTEKTSGVNINGTAEAGSMVTVGFGGINKTVAADMGGNWSVNYAATEVPVAGTYPVTATAQDANGNVGTTPASRSIIVAAAVNLLGQIVAGPVVTGNGLSVDIYLANGTLLVSGVKVNADGSFTANNLPVGTGDVIFARVLDSTTGADYLDEATGVPTDLNAVLLAAKAVEGTSVTMNINPLTTIAAIRAGLAADGSGTIANAAAATNANTATAQAFGLSGIDITTSSVVATNSGGYNPDDGMSSGEKIGAVLAALSGMDSLNAGNSQTTITSLSQSIGSNGELTSQGQVSLMRGAIAAEDKVDGSLQNLVSDSLAASSPEAQVTINAIATDNIITGNEVANLTLSGTVSSGATGVSVLLGTKTSAASVSGTTWSYTLSTADIAELGADGVKVIQAQAALPNAASATASRVVTLKIAPPAAPTLNVVSGDNAINGLEKTAGVAFSGTGEAGSIVVLTFGSVTKNVLVGSAGTWTTAFLASEIPADGSSTVSVVAKDSFGNSSAAVTRSIQIDTVAPSLAPIINPVTGDDLIGPSEKRVGIDIQGTADALAIISLTFGNFVRTATANALGVWSVRILSSQIPEDGETLVTATQSDAAGNVSAAATRTVNIDAQPPSKPVILPVATDNIVNATEKLSGIVLRGTAEPNTLIELNLGLINRTTRTLANGTWSVSLSPAQIPLDGTVNVSVTATDSSGNVSEAGTRTFTIDTVIQQPIIASIATDNVVNAAEKLTNLTVTGQGEPGANVVVTLGGTSRNVAINQSGAWLVSFLPAEIPGDTLQTAVTVQSTDQAGNISDMATQNIRIDTVAHATPVISTVAGDDLINATERAGTITVNGTAEAGAAVSVTWNGFVKNVIANTLGAWNATYTSAEQPSDGTSTITARATDTAGNVNAVDGTRSVTTLTTPPALPVINLVAGDDRINITERSNGITVTGTATNGARVEVTFGTTTKTVTANGTGVWNANFATTEVATEGAVRPITAVQTDVNGNISGTATRNVEVDLTASATPLISTPIAGNNIINAAEKAGDITVSGTATDAANVEVVWGDQTKTVAVTSGAWTVVFAASEVPADILTSTIRVTAIDTAGNRSAENTSNVRIDTVAHATPVISTVAVDDLINATERAGTITVNGTAEAGAAVSVTWNGVTKNVTANTLGAWNATYTSAEQPSDGTSTITARATDTAGNVNAVDGTRSVTTLTTPPALPVINLVAGDDRINITERSNGITVTGTATNGARVEVTFGTTTKTVTANGTGVWNANFATTEIAAEGAVRPITAVQTDVNGNISGTATRNVEVDLTLPVTPLITTPIAGNNIINAAEKNAGVTISGTAPNSTTVEVRIGGGTAKSVTSNGAWSITFAGTEIPADATGVVIEARTIDAAGNPSAWVAAAATVTIDTTPPAAAPTGLDLAADDDTGSSNSDNLTRQTSGLTITGKAGNNATVELFDGATSLGTTTANGSGDFTRDVTLAAGARSITAREIDSAGNASVASAALAITVDTTVAAPTSLDLDEADDKGSSDSDNITNQVSNLTITGQAEANASVQLFNGATSLGTTTASGTGAFSLDVTLGARVLPHSITAIATDTAGNVSVASAALTIIIDTTAPAAPKGVDPVAIPTLSNIVNGIGGFVINGVAAGDQSGISVRSAGDVNNDGLDDLIIGARFADPNGVSNAGASYVVFGKAGGASVNLSDVASGTRDLGFVINGAAAGDLAA